MFFGGYEKNRHERLLSLVVGLISWNFQQRPIFFLETVFDQQMRWQNMGIAAAICALRRYDVDLWLDFVSVIVDRTMISVGLIKEEIFVVRVAWISIVFFTYPAENQYNYVIIIKCHYYHCDHYFIVSVFVIITYHTS